MTTVAACSDRGDHEAEAQLRNHAQVVLARLHRLGPPSPVVPPRDAEQA